MWLRDGWSLNDLFNEILANLRLVIDFIELGSLWLADGLLSSKDIFYLHEQQSETDNDEEYGGNFQTDKNYWVWSRGGSISGLRSDRELRGNNTGIAR